MDSSLDETILRHKHHLKIMDNKVYTTWEETMGSTSRKDITKFVYDVAYGH